MPHIDNHPDGSFCWIELATTDQNAAKTFYAPLLGWSVNDQPMGPNEFYTMFEIEGRPAGAAYTIRPEQRAQGVPPHWLIYIAVANADEIAARAVQLGGAALAPAFDVFDVGRMAVLKDPAGAVFSVWQARKHKGTGITGVDGTLCWADLSTPDPVRAGKFYSDLFGWKILKGEKDDYLHIVNGEAFLGGIPPTAHRDPNTPPHWLPYFAVSDCDASAAAAQKTGAKLYLPPMSIENVGRMSVIADPQGRCIRHFQGVSAHGENSGQEHAIGGVDRIILYPTGH